MAVEVLKTVFNCFLITHLPPSVIPPYSDDVHTQTNATYSENVPPLMMFIPGEMYPYAHVYSDNVHTDDVHAVVTKCT